MSHFYLLKILFHKIKMYYNRINNCETQSIAFTDKTIFNGNTVEEKRTPRCSQYWQWIMKSTCNDKFSKC